VIIDPTTFVAIRRQDLEREADQARLAARLPHAPSAVRRGLAQGCVRLANWIDAGPHQYVPPSDSGPPDWVAGSAAV
jgi:hypothetical protein